MSKLIQIVRAQSEPTFPYKGPYERPKPTPPGDVTIRLSSSISTLQVNQTASCDVEIESGNEKITRYTIVLSFDPSVLEVIDANASQSGIQINFLDTFSTVQTNSANNSSGIITISANVSGNPQTINRKIAQISFKAKKTGVSVVSVNKSQSSVYNSQGANVLTSTTSVNFSVTGQTSQGTGRPQAPSSGIIDTAATIGSVIVGTLMLYIGIKSVLGKKNKKEIL